MDLASESTGFETGLDISGVSKSAPKNQRGHYLGDQ